MPVRHSCKQVGEFEIHTLSNQVASISIAPELGGRIVSLCDLISRREWLDGWMPVSGRRLWHPTDPADFATGPGAGIDECLPTVLPCEVGGSHLPDHGELWIRKPDFSIDPEGAFWCRWNLNSLPLAFSRRISLTGRDIHLDYRLENLADAPTPFLWAWHPLFSWKPGDQIVSTETLCHTPFGEQLPWPEAQPGTDLSRAVFPENITPAAKVFLGPLKQGHAEIVAKNGASLSLDWPSAQFPFAGIWITRGFWKNLHHWAIEPTNAPVDRLSDILKPLKLSLLAEREAREWTLKVGLSSR